MSKGIYGGIFVRLKAFTSLLWLPLSDPNYDRLLQSKEVVLQLWPYWNMIIREILRTIAVGSIPRLYDLTLLLFQINMNDLVRLLYLCYDKSSFRIITIFGAKYYYHAQILYV